MIAYYEYGGISENLELGFKERDKVISASIPPRILKESDAISPRLTDTLMEVAGAIPYHNLLARIISYSNRCYKALAACKNKIR